MTTEDYIEKRQALKKKYIETGDDDVLMQLMNLDRRKGARNENHILVVELNVVNNIYTGAGARK